MNDEKRDLPQQRAERVRYVREKVLRLTREEFQSRSGISPNSLQNWEQVRANGLTEMAARRLVQAFQKEGVNCTVEWLLYGIGEKPASPFSPSSMRQEINEEDNIHRELALFHELNNNGVDARISDDSMLPCFWPGDYVAGTRYKGESIKKAVGMPCIVETTDGTVLVKLLEMGENEGCYNLASANPHAPVKRVFKDVELNYAAPILWIRRRSFSN
jgi:hypothetical protein